MELNFHSEQDHIVRISVSGDIRNRSDVDKLSAIIGLKSQGRIEITFLDSNVLPADVVESLYYAQKLGTCMVFVLKRYLFTYLTGLGVKCKYITVKSIRKSSENIHGEEDSELSISKVQDFLRDINEKYGYDYTQYHIDSILRRIRISMLRQNMKDFNIYRRTVLENAPIFEQVFLDFSINTTEFFRDPQVFAVIRSRILPYLDSYSHLKIWCAGCSNGKEPYSLAILLHEAGILEKTQIYATDINPYVIEEAKNGLYFLDTLDKDIKNYRMSCGQGNFTDYFELSEKYMRVKEYMKRNILFFSHSLVGSGILNEFHLILCRNVLIYFNPKLQRDILDIFHNSLDLNGFLILGKSEGILQNGGHRLFMGYEEREKIYKRKSD